MYLHKATLIQDIHDYLNIVRELYNPYLDAFIHTGIDEEYLITWIVSEELELIYGLFDTKHMHNSWPAAQIHSLISSDLSTLTARYIKAPNLYDNNIVTITIRNDDLYISFYRPSFGDIKIIPLK